MAQTKSGRRHQRDARGAHRVGRGDEVDAVMIDEMPRMKMPITTGTTAEGVLVL